MKQEMTLPDLHEAMKSPKIEVVKNPNPAKNTEARAQDVLTGKMPPPNDTAAYLANRFQNVQARLKRAQAQHHECQATERQLRDMVLQLSGELAGLANDLEYWVDKENEK